MRALGPGSVSSFLKVILDVVRWVLMISAGAVTLGMIGVLLLSFSPDLLGSAIDLDDVHIKGAWMGPLLAGALLAGDLYLAGALVIVGRLRRIFQTLIAGDPFHPDNVRRLRTIGLTLAALEIGGYLADGATAMVIHLLGLEHSHALSKSDFHVGGGVHLTAWFSVLVIMVLAEVFREGARLRAEAELTI